MASRRERAIKGIFSHDFAPSGYWLTGNKGNGEFIVLHPNGTMRQHCWFGNSVIEGEYKNYSINGDLSSHSYAKNGRSIWNFKDGNGKYPIRDGYILGGDGKYYEDYV